MIIFVWETTDSMVGYIKIETSTKTYGRNIECTWCAQGVIEIVR